MATLAESVKAHGLLQPLLVQSRGGQHTLIEGVDRLRAVIAAGLRKAPCVTYDVDDHKAKALGEAARIQAQAASETLRSASGRTAVRAARRRRVDRRRRSRSRRCRSAPTWSPRMPRRSRAPWPPISSAPKCGDRRASCKRPEPCRETSLPASAPVPVRRLVDRVVKELMPEQRLRGFEVETRDRRAGRHGHRRRRGAARGGDRRCGAGDPANRRGAGQGRAGAAARAQGSKLARRAARARP